MYQDTAMEAIPLGVIIMPFRTEDDVSVYARNTYNMMAANVFELFGKVRGYYFYMEGIADGLGFGSNGVELSIGISILDDYEDYSKPIEAYGFARFSYSWEEDMEERMPLPGLVLFLKDACRVFCELHPEETEKAQAALAKAVATVEKMQAAHLEWKKAHPEV